MSGNSGSVVFAINGKRHELNVNGDDIAPSITLYDYLRQRTSCTVHGWPICIFCLLYEILTHRQ